MFLLSPARASGRRAQVLLAETAAFPAAEKLRTEGLTIADAFSFLSGLYFRGKVEFARAFAAPPPGVPGAWVILAGQGLRPLDAVLTHSELRAMADVPVEAGEPRFREPLERDARALCAAMSAECEVVLLGSIASGKYVDPLLGVFGDRLLFPEEFVGRGDMSRGGLMLRSAQEGKELTYRPVAGAVRRGRRPPKLPKRVT